MERNPFLAVFLAVFLVFSGCATATPPKPKVMLSPSQYPNSKNIDGVSIAVLPFDPARDLYADPNEANPPKPDFNWFKAGICLTRLIISNDSQAPIVIDPTQITCTDVKGTTYKPFTANEAGDAIIASEAFKSYIRGALAGVIVGSLVGAALGAALGGAIGGRSWAGRGAAIGATSGGAQGMALGAVSSRAMMETRIRLLLLSNQLMHKVLSPGMSYDGLVYFPAVQITSARFLLSDIMHQKTVKADIPVMLPPQEIVRPDPPAEPLASE